MSHATQKIVPNIWFNHDAEEAGAFYADALPWTTSEITYRYPAEAPDWQQDLVGTPLTIDVTIDGYILTLINGGPAFRPTPALSFMLGFDARKFDDDSDAMHAQFDSTWAKLAEGGRILMDVGEYPFSPRYGWVEDRYGVSWQLLVVGAESQSGPFVVPELMFSGAVQNRAREAAEFYASVFPDSKVGFLAEYPEQTGPATPGSVMFGEVKLSGGWLAIMDSAVEQDEPFTPAVSLEVSCADQAEIDRLWDALSAVPEAEQCGWLVDKFGVSWQIVPENMGDLLQREGAYAAMMPMKKIIIADL